ncbi:MAG: hypothetical protein ACYC3S_01325 [Chloroflexota bacterium]
MDDGEIEVATFQTETEAEMWAGVLRSEGIPSVMVPLGGGAGGFGPSVWRPFALRVRASDAPRARRVLHTLEHNEPSAHPRADRAPRHRTYRRRDS